MKMRSAKALRPRRWESFRLPSPGARNTTARIPVYAETGFRVFERHDPLTGKDWTFAVVSDYWTNSDPSPADGIVESLTRGTWMREGPRPAVVIQEVVESGADGWLQATNENLAWLSRVWQQRIREEQKRLNLAKQRGIHLLRCSACDELADLDARDWRLVLEVDGATRALCPRCER